MKNIKFTNVYINDYFTLLGSLEHKPTIAKKVDKIIDEYYVNKKTPEEGESEYQNIVVSELLNKNNFKDIDIDLMIGADLQNQLFASNFNAINYNISFLGVYSACASFVEGLIVASALIQAKGIKSSIVVTSSNNLVTEKQFRFPIEYGAVKKKVNSFTCSGAVSAMLTNKKSKIKVESANIGKIIDMGCTDTNDMGSAMAPGVAETLYDHFISAERKPSYYDVILTGDLGVFGTFILKEYMLKKYKIKLNNVVDAGTIIYNNKPDSDFAGASGPVCAPLVLFSDLIKKYKKILVVASGSLHSCVSANLKKQIPGVGHAISLEVLE